MKRRRRRRNNNCRGIVLALFCVVFLFVGMAYANTSVELKVEGKATIAGEVNFTISRSAITVQIGNKEKINALIGTTDISSSVVWTSSNSNVATVDNTGMVTALSQGKTVITVKYGELYAECLVTVVDNDETNPYIEISVREDNFGYGGNYIYYSDINITNIAGMTLKTWSFDFVFPNGTEYNMQRYGGYTEENQGYAFNGNTVYGENLDGTITISGGIKLPDGYEAEDYVPIKIRNVKVTFETVVEAESIELDKESLTMFEGDVDSLTASVLPLNCESEVEWTSSNNEIVTVSNGIVTAKKEGTAIITAKVDNVSKTCSVTVNKVVVVELERLELSETEVTINKREKINLIASKYPTNATGKITWASNNPDVAIVDSNGTVTGVSEGTAVITAICGDKTASCSVVVEDKPLVVAGDFVCRIATNNVWGDNRITYATLVIENNSEYDMETWSMELPLPSGMTTSGTQIYYQNWESIDATLEDNIITGTNLKKGRAIYISALITLPEGYDFNDYFDKDLGVKLLESKIRE